MRIIADFHIHSKYARATSKFLDLPLIDKWARIKGINLIGTGDFTHPAWSGEMKKYLEPAENGFYTLKPEVSTADPQFAKEKVYFVPTAEIATIYTQGGKGRRLHTVLMVPDLEAVAKINEKLGRSFNIRSDGRPIIGLSAKDLARVILEIEPRSLIIPAHIWTPWFAVFGSKSGFDSIEECYEDMASEIYALETGISSDPSMNWQLSNLDKYTLISNSDAHSAGNLGRESNVFDLPENEFSYDEIVRIIKKKDQDRFKFTIEYFPEEGLYHWDGHRSCKYRVPPEESKKLNCICPVCGRPTTVGVLHRVGDLSDRSEAEMPVRGIPFKKFMPLDEIVAQALGKGVNTKGVLTIYNQMIADLGAEYPLLLDTSYEILAKNHGDRIAQAIQRVRDGNLTINPGYDGEYGVVKIFE